MVHLARRLDDDQARWIRLFPVQWQWFWGKQHPKYQILDIDVAKHDRDQRPESHRPRLDTATIVDQIPSGRRRARILNELPQHTMCDLVAAKGWSRPSLALVVPREVTGFDWEDHTGDASHARKMNRAAQPSLLAQDAPTLEFCPYSFKFSYRCWSPTCRGHGQPIADWEISEAWRRWRVEYPDDYLDRIRAKWLGLVEPERQPGFFVGNQHQAPQAFMVLGVTRGITRREPSPADQGGSAHRKRSTGDSRTDPPRSTEGRLFDP